MSAPRLLGIPVLVVAISHVARAALSLRALGTGSAGLGARLLCLGMRGVRLRLGVRRGLLLGHAAHEASGVPANYPLSAVRAWGAHRSITGPSGTIWLGLIVGWLVK